MPNLIEQQDLLKGLPDARLATLLQNPVATVPPFLVAAEAQRRQAIRQQFAGPDSKESVVDTLTKQMANVPENIRATPAPTPAVPSTPQMQGVMALQQQQAMQQAAQPQQMRQGGMVQRYAGQGLVTPSVEEMAASITGMTPEQYLAAEKQRQIESLGPGRARYLLEHPFVPKTEKQKAEEEFKAATTGLFSGMYSPESRYKAAQAVMGTSTTPSLSAPEVASDIAAQKRRLDTTGRAPAAQPPKADAGKAGTSPENKAKTPEDDLRKQLAALYAPQDISDWEKAQRWFAMAAQFLDPSKTTMQSIAGAGQAFAAEAGSQAQAQREAELAGKKALLEYDIAERNRQAAAAADAAKYQRELAASAQKSRERFLPTGGDMIRAISDRMKDIDAALAEIGIDDATKQSLIAERDQLAGQRSFLMQSAGLPSIMTTSDLRKSVGPQKAGQ